MKVRNTKLVLAGWMDVEPDDVIFHAGELFRVTGEPYPVPALGYSWLSDRAAYMLWPVDSLENTYPGEKTLMHRPSDQVPVVVP